MEQPITSHIQKDLTPPEEGGGYPFKGHDGAYELCDCNMIQIVPAAYTDKRIKHPLEGDLYCDEEGLMNGAQHNWRASQMRYWHMKPREDQLTADWRDWCNIVGDACFVVPATEENLKMMEHILDS